MPIQTIYVAISTIVFVAMVSLLRSRKLREKYAMLWLLVSVAIVTLALVPQLLSWLAGALGFQVPSNLLFTLAILLLLGVTLHLSLEISRLEDETRVLAENVAILNMLVHDQRPAGTTPAPGPDAHPDE
ncbi:DUF2304 domain-containing protein [Actinomyces sp. W5033]|uniref:DUF2304 domain-containing protein n=1 Tax=Actinomyces sp. W5033 TaxID=3446479 RepID=UPI003EE12F24